jgi:hypothetical protein
MLEEQRKFSEENYLLSLVEKVAQVKFKPSFKGGLGENGRGKGTPQGDSDKEKTEAQRNKTLH